MDYKVKLEFHVSLNRAFDTRKLGEDVQDLLDEWSDGRQILSVELLTKALEEILTSAARSNIEREIVARVGNVMVSTSTGRVVKNIRRSRSCTRLSGIKTAREMQNFDVRVVRNTSVTIKPDHD